MRQEDTKTEILKDYSPYSPGVTVEEDAGSPTGCTATFIYDELDSYEGLGKIVKVQMYSDCKMLFETGSGMKGMISPDDMHAPEEYQAGPNWQFIYAYAVKNFFFVEQPSGLDDYAAGGEPLFQPLGDLPRDETTPSL